VCGAHILTPLCVCLCVLQYDGLQISVEVGFQFRPQFASILLLTKTYKDYKGYLAIVKAQALSGIQIGELTTAGMIVAVI
jgi:hypothetical protein